MKQTVIRRFGISALCLCLASTLQATPFRLVAIGDSLSKEYQYEVSFTAPDPTVENPTPSVNVRNWPELLIAHRPLAFTMGSKGTYADFRLVGHEYNYSIPGSKAEFWDGLLYREYGFFELLDPRNSAPINTRKELRGDILSVNTNAVLIFLGGNDLSLSNDIPKHLEIRDYLARIHSWVRNNGRPGIPIIISTVPDIGATPAEKLTDPATAAIARQRVAALNAEIAAIGSLPNTYVARIDAITDRIFDQNPFHINGTEFINAKDPENPPLYLFCKDGFHPGTAAQALIANEILKAINQFASTPIPLFTNREILSTALALNPDQPYLDFAGSAGAMLGNPDSDALPNLIEFLLATSPTQANPGFTFLPGGAATFTPSPTAQRFADLTVLQSETLTNDWIPVPANNIQTLPDGSRKIIPSSQKLFYKFQATPKP